MALVLVANPQCAHLTTWASRSPRSRTLPQYRTTAAVLLSVVVSKCASWRRFSARLLFHWYAAAVASSSFRKRWSSWPETVILPGCYCLPNSFGGFFVFSHRLDQLGPD